MLFSDAKQDALLQNIEEKSIRADHEPQHARGAPITLGLQNLKSHHDTTPPQSTTPSQSSEIEATQTVHVTPK